MRVNPFHFLFCVICIWTNPTLISVSAARSHVRRGVDERTLTDVLVPARTTENKLGADGRVDTVRKENDPNDEFGNVFKVHFERFRSNFSSSIPLFHVFILFACQCGILTICHSASSRGNIENEREKPRTNQQTRKL